MDPDRDEGPPLQADATPDAPKGHVPEGPAPAGHRESEVLERLRSGDEAAFQAALRPLLPALLSLGRRLTNDPHWAEDLVQETLIRAFRGIAGFRGESSLRTWLFQIQVRLAGQPRRWRGRAEGVAPDGHRVPDAVSLPPDQSSRERELAERLDEALERLTPRQRTALHLRAAEGLDYRAIAQVLGGSAPAARMLVLAARRQIMRRMGRHLAP